MLVVFVMEQQLFEQELLKKEVLEQELLEQKLLEKGVLVQLLLRPYCDCGHIMMVAVL